MFLIKMAPIPTELTLDQIGTERQSILRPILKKPRCHVASVTLTPKPGKRPIASRVDELASEAYARVETAPIIAGASDRTLAIERPGRFCKYHGSKVVSVVYADAGKVVASGLAVYNSDRAYVEATAQDKAVAEGLRDLLSGK
jgi:hypothetical protein